MHKSTLTEMIDSIEQVLAGSPTSGYEVGDDYETVPVAPSTDEC